MDGGYGGYDGGYGGYGGGGGDYGGAAAGGYGGAYDATGGGGGGYGSQPAASQAKKNYGNQMLLPLTIRQLNTALAAAADSKEPPSVDGKNIKDSAQIRLVGRIVDMNDQTSRTTFTITDGTGTTSCAFWMDTDDNELLIARRSSWAIGAYITMFCKLTDFGDGSAGSNVQALDARPVTDYNEITHHFLDAVVSHLHATKGPLPRPIPAGGAVAAAPAAAADPFGGGYGGAAAGGYGYGGAPSAYGSTGAYDGYSAGGQYGGYNAGGAYAAPTAEDPMHGQILAAFQATHSDSGLSIDQVAGSLGIDAARVGKVAEALALEGSLYNTIDDQHYRSTS